MRIAERWQAIGMNSAGLSNRWIAVNFGVNNFVADFEHAQKPSETAQYSVDPVKQLLGKTVTLIVKPDYSHCQLQCNWEVCGRLVVASV